MKNFHQWRGQEQERGKTEESLSKLEISATRTSNTETSKRSESTHGIKRDLSTACAPRSRSGDRGAAKSSDKPLQSLTPHYQEEHHGSYLKRLEEAVNDPGNLNIAVTGRYGSGKSSVLSEFEARNKRTVLRLSISTLAPNQEGDNTTNRIQKEIVKLLLYSASEKVGRNSRFNKIAVLTKRKAFMQSATVVLSIISLAFLFGFLPQPRWPASDAESWVKVSTWVAVVILLTTLGAMIRLLTHGRYDVKDMSAVGAALTLSEKPQTFFDKYLDEIVHYFNQEKKQTIIFEDLDRFEDPYIFEALRELNLLLNDTPSRRKKRNGNNFGLFVSRVLGRMNEEWPSRLEVLLPPWWAGRLLGLGEPLRFIYAVRDSVFSQIENGPEQTAPNRTPNEKTSTDRNQTEDLPQSPNTALSYDEASEETKRANRTKFFDIVIPLVPFISHRNARDLLVELLVERGIKDIDTQLINTVAQHCTDMRLMRNVCNEYLIFAERLLEPVSPATRAPGLDSTHLFALVVYKNFHLEDFENIPQRKSDLDRLYDFAQRLTRVNISSQEKYIHNLQQMPEKFRESSKISDSLGKRLDLFANSLRSASSKGFNNSWRLHRFKVGGRTYGADEVTSYQFWAAVQDACVLEIEFAHQESGGNTTIGHSFDSDNLRIFFPEALDADRWHTLDLESIESEKAAAMDAVALLRRADFSDLVTSDFALTLTGLEATAKNLSLPTNSANRYTFSELTDACLKSELARDLVRRGFIDRNYSLYSAHFYGNFTGVDVANFMVQHVQPKIMNVDYDLSRVGDGEREGAVANLLLEAEESGEDILNSVAAYNIDLLNHLLSADRVGASTLARHLINHWPSEPTRTFLAAYFNSTKANGEQLVELLARGHWRKLFTYLTTDEDVPVDSRVALVNAAIASYEPDAKYYLGEDFRRFVTGNYHKMTVFVGEKSSTTELSDQESSAGLPDRLDVLMRRGKIILPELSPLRDEIIDLVVDSNRYTLTAENLRTALHLGHTEPVPLDILIDQNRGHDKIYAFILSNLPAYLSAIDADTHTMFAVTAPKTLAKVLVDIAAQWNEEHASEAKEEPDSDLIESLFSHTSSTAQLSSLSDAPQATWNALARANLFRPSLANIERYRTEVDGIDVDLAKLLSGAGIIHIDKDEESNDPDGIEIDRQNLAIDILNVDAMSAQLRVGLVSSLEPSEPLPTSDINVEKNDLFARLLQAGHIGDDSETFEHIHSGGWAAVGPAIASSKGIHAFLAPGHIQGMVADALADGRTSGKVATAVLGGVDEYVPEDDWSELQAVALYSDQHQIGLRPEDVTRMARVGHNSGEPDVPLILRLLDRSQPTVSADQIVETFQFLGEPYNFLAKRTGTFELEINDVHDRLLKILQSKNRITRGYPRVPKRRYSVTVL